MTKKEPILTPEQQQAQELREKQARLAKEVKEMLDKEGMEIQVVQNIIVIPKK